MERELPEITIEGTLFIVDLKGQLLFEKGSPSNMISFLDMDDNGVDYTFRALFNEHDRMVSIPPLKELDPIGMKEIYGCSEEDLKTKTDFEIMINQSVIADRLRGVQPILYIEGHPFFIDLHWGYLRPKDDFSTVGISLEEVEMMGEEVIPDHFRVAYNPKKHELAQIEWEQLTEIPKDIVVVDIAAPHLLDPVKWAQLNDCSINEIARRHPPQRETSAKTISWEDTAVHDLIKANKERMKSETGLKKTESNSIRKRYRGI